LFIGGFVKSWIFNAFISRLSAVQPRFFAPKNKLYNYYRLTNFQRANAVQ